MLFTFSQVSAYLIPNSPSPITPLVPPFLLNIHDLQTPSSFMHLLIHLDSTIYNFSCIIWEAGVERISFEYTRTWLQFLMRFKGHIAGKVRGTTQIQVWGKLPATKLYCLLCISFIFSISLFYFVCVEVSIVIVFLFISFLFLTVLTLHIFVTKQFGIEQFINVIMFLWIIPFIYIKLLSY